MYNLNSSNRTAIETLEHNVKSVQSLHKRYEEDVK